MNLEATPIGEFADRREVGGSQRFPALGVLQANQPRLGEVVVVRLDGRSNIVEVQGTVVAEGEGLGLDAAEYRSATALEAIGVRVLARDVLVASATVGK